MPFKGKFMKPNLILLDKFKPATSVKQYKAFHTIVNQHLVNHRKFLFLDEKHLCNKDTIPKKIRGNPLTGECRYVMVSGDFHFKYSMFACITADAGKQRAVEFMINKENGNSTKFLVFVEYLIAAGFIHH